MRYFAITLLMFSSVAHAAPPRGPDPAIRECTLEAQGYNIWALNFRRMFERNSSDYGGRVDASLIRDLNFALVSAGEYVHTNIKYVQTAQFRDEEPSTQDCMDITLTARDQIETYARHLLRDVHPKDRRGRESLLQEFRVGLQENTRRFKEYRSGTRTFDD